MSTMTRRSHRWPPGDIFDWLESPAGLSRPASGNPLPVEDYVTAGHYVLRAELPGVDPGRDVELTVSGGILTIKADRLDETDGTHRSEFRYGAFARRVPLPAHTDLDRIQARYADGILEVTVPLTDDRPGRRHIPVTRSPAGGRPGT